MHRHTSSPSSPVAGLKNRSFHVRIGFALAGIRTVFKRERSFRMQCVFALAAVAVSLAWRVHPLWAALVALSIALVLALELINAALEYLIDRVHPEIATEIGHAKDAAAGAVLTASIAALVVGGLAALNWLDLA